MSIFTRMFGGVQRDSASLIMTEPKRLIVNDEIKTLGMLETKANSIALLPRGTYGDAYQFFSPDGGRTIIDGSMLNGATLAFVAYWYVAVRWRAQKIAEAPLMVVQEDQDSGEDEWLSDHELVPVLDMPSPDFDMGELLERTSRYLDDTGECIWVKDYDGVNRVARLMPFNRNEFTVRASSDRLYQTFTVSTRNGPKDFDAADVCYFRDAIDSSWRFVNQRSGYARLDVAMSWLRLGETSRQTIRDLLSNAIWPSAVVIPDKEWNPDEKALAAYKQELEQYGAPGRQGKPFVQLGGGSFTQLVARVKDLVPEEVLNRVESVVAAVSGVPAIVLQYQVGLENSPWSQMAQARRMAYDDTIIPTWRKFERVLTHQLLRPMDEEPTHFIRFDQSDITALQMDQHLQAQVAVMMGRAASLNERRSIMGLEPATQEQDPEGRADDIPELTTPDLASLLAAGGAKPPGNDSTTPPKPDPAKPEDGATQKSPLRLLFERKMKPLAMTRMLRQEASTTWKLHASILLKQDRAQLVDIVSSLLADEQTKTIEGKARNKASAMRAVDDYLRTESTPKWIKTFNPLEAQGAQRSVAVMSADLGVNYDVLQKTAMTFTRDRVQSMMSGIGKTTSRLISDIIDAGIQEGRSTKEIAQLISDATGLSDTRAELIANTETTAVFSGAPIESLSAFGKATGRVFLKTWFGVMDDKERDEHIALEGETVGIDEPFSNGLQYPSEPNCRCAAITHEEED